MAVEKSLSFEDWRQSRIHLAKVAGIDVLFRIVSVNLLLNKGEDLLSQISAIEDYKSQSWSDNNTLWLATVMREVLDTILPDVLQSPKWLTEALDDFEESEIIKLYNAVMYGVGVQKQAAGK
ncbi:MAG: hypothetical protein OXF83_00030 [Anaerolineaceae bacterium]|nr:hypothetical protein [Anaerolineaceae bacterium]MCY3934730.1 hypothetical protein [Chloroflexota bacterium]MCY4009980.1 hypothetical protein [Anaerolineaceae bacterium]MCY4105911.1 hypothetical protein [Chloroflexota bacterium]